MVFSLFGTHRHTAEAAVASPHEEGESLVALATASEEPTSADVAVAAGENASKSDASVDACPNCGSTDRWGLSPWCPHCFYYPKLDAVMVPEGERDTSYDPTLDAHPADFDSVPVWARILAAGVMVIFLASVAAAVLLPADEPIRAYWTLTQVGLGLIAACTAHLLAFFNAVPQTDRFGPFDIVVHPFEVWSPTIRNLPRHAWRLWQAVWGVTAILWALTLIGGIDYSAIFDCCEAETKVRTNVAPTLLPESKTAKKKVNSFEAAKRKLHSASKNQERPSKIEAVKTEPASPRHAECFIIGYTKNPVGGFSSILLGSYVGGRLIYVGSLSASQVPDDVRAALRKRLPQLERSKPVVETGRSATWLRPVISCRIGYKDLTSSKTLNEPTFNQLLDEAIDDGDNASPGRDPASN